MASLTMDVIRIGKAKADLLNLELVRMGVGSGGVGSPSSAVLAAELEAQAVLALLDDLARLQHYEDRAEARIRRIFGPTP